MEIRPEDTKKVLVLAVAILGIFAITGFVVAKGRPAPSSAPKEIVMHDRPVYNRDGQRIASSPAPAGGSRGAELESTVAELFSRDYEYNSFFKDLDPFRPKVREASGSDRTSPPPVQTNQSASHDGVPVASNRPPVMQGDINSGGTPSGRVEPVRPNMGNIRVEPTVPPITVNGVLAGGESMAVLNVGGTTKYLGIGELASEGVRVKSITPAGVRLSVNGEERFVPVGKDLS